MLTMATIIPPSAGATGGPILNGFYAIQSHSGLEQIQGLDTVSFGWARIACDQNKQVTFTTASSPLSEHDLYPEYHLPQGYQDVLAYTQRVNPQAKKYLQLFTADQQVIALLLNLDSRSLTKQVIEPLIEQLNKLDLDGVVIDIEGLRRGTGTAQKFNDFLAAVDQGLGNKELIVAVPPLVINGVDQGYAYDYQYIGQVADSVILMAHDYQHCAEGKISIAASAPYYLVKEAVEQAIKPRAIPPEKLILQVSLSVEQWRHNQHGYSYHAPSTNQLNDALAGKAGQVVRATPEADRFIIHYGTPSRPLYNVGYTHLIRKHGDSVVEDEFYYENSRSILSKINLAAQYNLKGLSIWRLGLGDKKLWQDVTQYMQANQQEWTYGVTGIAGHWAEQDILELAARGVFIGKENKKLQPDSAATRGQFAHFLVRALQIQPVPGQSFKDIKAGDQYYDSMAAASAAGIVTGFPDGTARPDELINREQMATMMIRAYKYMGLKMPEAKELSFQDKLAVSDFAKGSVSQAVELGIIRGYADGNFMPKERASVAQSLVMINRLVKLM